MQLAASVSVNSSNHLQGGIVTFAVHDIGSTAAGQVTVTITLPAGAAMASGGGNGDGNANGNGNASLISARHSHWNCQPTSSGASCTLASLAAGDQAWGAIYFTMSGSSVCGQPVNLTAASGSASASARSTVAC